MNERAARSRTGGGRRAGAAVLVALGLLLAFVGISGAHGPTIKISHDAMKPVLLNLFVGTTVHFANQESGANENTGSHVVVEVEGKLESPELVEKGDGWHYTFEEEGTYEVFVRSHPEAKARIVVVPKRRPGAPAQH